VDWYGVFALILRRQPVSISPEEISDRRVLSMKRAVGYCENIYCEDFGKGVFLLNHGDTFYCPRCRDLGFVETEVSVDDDTHDGLYKTVRVEFNFNVCNKTYPEVAIVDIPELTEGGTYTIKSPLIRTEQRALKVAESVIGHVNSGKKNLRDMDSQTLMSMDGTREEFAAECAKLDVDLALRSRRLHELCP
jgi:ribosomal protein S27AE